MARPGQKTTSTGRKATGGRSTTGSQKKTSSRRSRPGDDVGIIPILARAVREVENAAERGKASPANRTKFQVIALLMRDERARAKSDVSLTDAERSELLKRLDGVATILAKTAARDTSLIQLLADDAKISDAAKKLRRDLLIASGTELSPDELIIVNEPAPVAPAVEKQVVPQSVRQAQMANPF
ncbi:MAG: ATP-dependent helicase, partial [Terrimesophilobacter sp.]